MQRKTGNHLTQKNRNRNPSSKLQIDCRQKIFNRSFTPAHFYQPTLAQDARSSRKGKISRQKNTNGWIITQRLAGFLTLLHPGEKFSGKGLVQKKHKKAGCGSFNRPF